MTLFPCLYQVHVLDDAAAGHIAEDSVSVALSPAAWTGTNPTTTGLGGHLHASLVLTPAVW